MNDRYEIVEISSDEDEEAINRPMRTTRSRRNETAQSASTKRKRAARDKEFDLDETATLELFQKPVFTSSAVKTQRPRLVSRQKSDVVDSDDLFVFGNKRKSRGKQADSDSESDASEVEEAQNTVSNPRKRLILDVELEDDKPHEHDTAIEIDLLEDEEEHVERGVTPPPQDLDFVSALSPKIVPFKARDIETSLQFDIDVDPDIQAVLDQNKARSEMFADQTVTIRVKNYENDSNSLPTATKTFRIRMVDKLEKVMAAFANICRVDLAKITFLIGRVVAYKYSTPLSLKMVDNSVIYAVHKDFYPVLVKQWEDESRKRIEQPNEEISDDEAEAAQTSEEEDLCVHIKLNNRGSVDRVKLKKSSTLRQVADHYKRVKKLASSTRVSFKWDGEQLNLDDTIEDLDVEDDDQFDVSVQ